MKGFNMAETGIILRRKDKADFSESNIVSGELVYATDTGEHGWKDETGSLVWSKLNVGGSSAPLFEKILVTSNIDNNWTPIVYSKPIVAGDLIEGSIRIRWTTGTGSSWIPYNFSYHQGRSGSSIRFKSDHYTELFFAELNGNLEIRIAVNYNYNFGYFDDFNEGEPRKQVQNPDGYGYSSVNTIHSDMVIYLKTSTQNFSDESLLTFPTRIM